MHARTVLGTKHHLLTCIASFDAMLLNILFTGVTLPPRVPIWNVLVARRVWVWVSNLEEAIHVTFVSF